MGSEEEGRRQISNGVKGGETMGFHEEIDSVDWRGRLCKPNKHGGMRVVAFVLGRNAHVMTFEVGAVLEDEKWQAPVYCFDKNTAVDGGSDIILRKTTSMVERFLRNQ